MVEMHLNYCCTGAGAGGGGAGYAASSMSGSGSNGYPTDGGNGISSSITGVPSYYAAGGCGGSWWQATFSDSYTYKAPGSKFYGIGGSGGYGDSINGANGLDGTGSGGGGGGASTSLSGLGGSGGSGIVIVRYIN